MPFLKDRTKIPRSQQLENMAKKRGPRHTIYHVTGDRYLGDWKENFKEGKGTLLTTDRYLYEGDFRKGYRDGFGILAYERKNKTFALEYRGSWKMGRRHGSGIRRYKDGGVYIGMWKNGKRHGYGHMWYPDGHFYYGNFVEDKRQGQGLLVQPDTSRYEGDWDNDLKHGKGRFLHLANGQMQEGVWVKDICVFCTFRDITYRQSSLNPTKYPIHKIALPNLNEICKQQEIKALTKSIHSCLTLSETASSSEMNMPFLDK